MERPWRSRAAGRAGRAAVARCLCGHRPSSPPPQLPHKPPQEAHEGRDVVAPVLEAPADEAELGVAAAVAADETSISWVPLERRTRRSRLAATAGLDLEAIHHHSGLARTRCPSESQRAPRRSLLIRLLRLRGDLLRPPDRQPEVPASGAAGQEGDEEQAGGGGRHVGQAPIRRRCRRPSRRCRPSCPPAGVAVVHPGDPHRGARPLGPEAVGRQLVPHRAQVHGQGLEHPHLQPDGQPPTSGTDASGAARRAERPRRASSGLPEAHTDAHVRVRVKGTGSSRRPREGG